MILGVLLKTFYQQERSSSKNNVSVPAVFEGSGISGTAQSERMSQESKNAWKNVKDDDLDAHLKAYEQALGFEKALQFEQFQMEDEEMAPEALVGKKRKRKPRMPLEQRNAWRMRWKKKVVG